MKNLYIDYSDIDSLRNTITGLEIAVKNAPLDFFVICN